MSDFHYPKDIELPSNPLLEAWLEIRWKLESVDHPPIQRDPYFPFALGKFFDLAKERFPKREDLEASKAPLDVLPYHVRHRFRSRDGDWPILQLGPGVASVNFTKPYSWEMFESEARFLVSCLQGAYADSLPEYSVIILRYRNIHPFDYSENNYFDFLAEKLNTKINLPLHIPGGVSSSHRPTSSTFTVTFDLEYPKGTGKIQFGTGTGTPPWGDKKHEKIVLWEIEFATGETDMPKIEDENEINQWLNSAHSVIHEWFLAMIEGELTDQYRKDMI